MESFLIFLLKSCLWISVFWVVYRLFLHNETFHRFNRWFLLTGLSLSFVLPLFQFYYPEAILAAVPAEPPAWIFAVADPTPISSPAPSAPDWTHLAIASYVVVIAFQLARSLMEVRRINRLIAKYGYTQHFGYRLVEVDMPIAPFSFRNYIFINRSKITDIEASVIIAHESSHIRQRHWIDLLAGAALRIAQWINPFAYLLVREMKENHEFMADKAVLDDGNSIAVYKAVLINSSFGERIFTLGHPFSSSNNLKRYRMMNKKLSPASRKLSVLVIFPLAALFFMAFAKPRYTVIEKSTVPVAENKAVEIKTQASDSVVIERSAVKTHEVKPDSTNKVAIAPNKKIEADKVKVIVDKVEMPFEYLERLEPDKIKSITILKDSVSLARYGAKDIEAVMIAETFVIEKENETTPDPIFIVDGIRVTTSIAESLSSDKIESISVLKEQAAVALHGEDGRNGVVVITLKKESGEKTKGIIVTKPSR